MVYQIDGFYEECRGIEQMGMIYYHCVCRNGGINNRINGISPRNLNRTDYFNAGMRFFLTVSKYLDLANAPSENEWWEIYWKNVEENERLNGGV